METLLAVNVFARLHARRGGRSSMSLAGKKAPSAQEFFLKALIDFGGEEKWAVAAERRPRDACSWATAIISSKTNLCICSWMWTHILPEPQPGPQSHARPGWGLLPLLRR